ncbi:hypothetical protein C1H76_8458 [Elsinoe australis]|uniref:Uncharacterized protein n=1 Tax=Elsinoe australis TaxID=40998 RepID=A0A4U7AMG8_9PEZI|nr:hypothetical protein C1H76_8458 [Elsinoe australis]
MSTPRATPQPHHYSNAAYIVPEHLQHEFRSTAGQRIDNKRWDYNGHSRPPPTPIRETHKRVWDPIGGTWSIIPDPSQPQEPYDQRTSMSSDRPSGKRQYPIDLTEDFETSAPKRPHTSATFQSAVPQTGEKPRRYFDLTGQTDRARPARSDDGNQRARDRDPSAPRSTHHTAASSLGTYGDATRRQTYTDKSGQTNRTQVSNLGNFQFGIDNGFRSAFEFPARRSNPAAPHPKTDAPARKNNRHMFVEDEDEDEDNSLFIHTTPTPDPLPSSPLKDISLSVLEKAAEDLKRQEGMTFGIKKEGTPTSVIKKPGELTDLTKIDDEDIILPKPKTAADVDGHKCADQHKPSRGFRLPTYGSINPNAGKTSYQKPSFEDYSDELTPHKKLSYGKPDAGSGPEKPQQSEPARKHTSIPQGLSDHSATPLASTSYNSHKDLAEKPLEAPDKPPQSQSIGKFPQDFDHQYSFTTHIPDSLRRDSQWVSQDSIEKNAQAGASRNIIGKASKGGFNFGNMGTGVTDRSKEKRKHTDRGDDLLESSPAGRKEPVSFRRLAGIEAAAAAQEEPSDDEDTRQNSDVTASGNKQTGQNHKQNLAAWKKPNRLTTAEEYIIDGARRGIYARSICDRLNRHFPLDGDEKWIPSQVQKKAEELTGLFIQRREKAKPKKKSLLKPPRTQPTSTGADDREETSSSTPSPAKKKQAPSKRSEPEQRPTVAGKRPIEGWLKKYQQELHASGSDSEDDQATPEQRFQPRAPGSDSVKVKCRPINVYVVRKGAVLKADFPPDFPEDEISDYLDELSHEVDRYISRREAHQKAIELVFQGIPKDWEVQKKDVDGLPCYLQQNDYAVIQVSVKKVTNYRTDIELPRSACITEGKVWEVKETVKLVWKGAESVRSGHSFERSTVSMTQEALGEAQEGHAAGVEEQTEQPTTAEETGMHGDQNTGEAAEEHKKLQGEVPHDVLGKEDGEDVDMEDLFGEDELQGAAQGKAVEEAVSNGSPTLDITTSAMTATATQDTANEATQATDHSTLDTTGQAAQHDQASPELGSPTKVTQTEQEPEQEPHQTPASQPTATDTADAVKQTWKIPLSKKFLNGGIKFNLLEEANHFATEEILERMIYAFPKKSRNLDAVTFWKSQVRAEWNQHRDDMTRDKEGVHEVKVRQARRVDFPAYMREGVSDQEAGDWAVVWKIKVLERGVSGAVN